MESRNILVCNYDHPTFRRHPQCTTDISMLQVQAATSRHTGLEKRDRSWSLMSGNTQLSHTAAKIIDRVCTLLFDESSHSRSNVASRTG